MAKKKIYDVVPPKARKARPHRVSHKKEAVPVHVAAEKNERVSHAAHHSPQRSVAQRPSKGRRWLVVGIAALAVAVIIAAGYAYYALAQANVQITMRTSPVSFSAIPKLTLDSSAAAPDLKNGVIPAHLLTQQQQGSQQFPATGDASNQGTASGTIRIYNKSASALTLRKGTHFLSDSGKYFITMQGVSIPAAHGSTPGSVSVAVQAQESGPEYNIGPAKFSVPGLTGTSYYYVVWGASTAPMTGGASGKIKMVTSEDISQAEDTLAKQLQQQATDALKKQLASGETLIDGVVSASVTNESSTIKTGTTADQFGVNATVSVTGLAVKQSDLDAWISAYVASQMSQGGIIVPKSEQVTYQVVSFDAAKGVAVVQPQISASMYSGVDMVSLVNQITGKSVSQIRDTITQQCGGISSVTVNLSPFWVKHAPKNPKHIHISLDFAPAQ